MTKGFLVELSVLALLAYLCFDATLQIVRDF